MMRCLLPYRPFATAGPSARPRCPQPSNTRRASSPSSAANAIVVDLGSGGGLPGLVIAARRPDVQLTLVERRATRADLLRRAVAVLDLGGRVTVRTADARSLAVSGPQFDTVTARSFGPPLLVARVAAPLCVSGGEAIVSEPPPSAAEVSDRWPTAELAALGWDDLGPVTGLRHLRRR